MLGYSEKRLQLLLKLIEYRRALRATGLSDGRHWIDGSFVENKEPNDIDLVTLIRSTNISDDPDVSAITVVPFLDRDTMKQDYDLDAIIIDMDGSTEIMLDRIGFYLVLFSHRRDDFLWKGLLSIELSSNDNDDAAEHLIQTRLGVRLGA